MTRAVLYRDRSGKLTGFSVRGHAGYAEEGSDIVCAGISVLTTTCVNALESVAGVKVHLRGGEDGFLEAMLPQNLDDMQMHDAQVLLSALHQGLSDLADGYPKYIQLSVRRG
ncbi:MAG: ribosomal-processing cysteine protease Prp [Clostridia bacterium]|nr:ribosomal-processing cysteine protease Prp [Clostridia bacterium]